VRQLPHLQELHDRYGDAGLHVLLVESQHHEEDEVRAFLGERAITVPCAILDWSDFPMASPNSTEVVGYDPSHLPRVYLIGGDGAVLSDGAKFDEAQLEAELKKVRYPGLFRKAVAKELDAAAEAFGKREFGAARSLATKALEAQLSADARADAEHILARVVAVANRDFGRAEALLADRRFLAARELFTELERAFAKDDRAARAKEQLDSIAKHADAKRGITAEKELRELLIELRAAPRKTRAEKLAAFAKKHDGTVAGADAAAYAARAAGE